MKRALLIVFLLLLGINCQAIEYPQPTGFVNDYAKVMQASEVKKTEELCRQLEKKTGAEIAVVTVQTTSPLDSKTYAVEMFQKWGIGKKGKDNGLLILLAMNEKRVEIEVGYGLEGTINDAKAGEILDQFAVPQFKEGKFGEGLYQTAAAIAVKIADDKDAELGDKYEKYRPSSSDFNIPDAAGIIVVILIIIASALPWKLVSGGIGAIVGGIFGYIVGGVGGMILGAILAFLFMFIAPFFRPFTYWGGGWGGGFGGGGGGFGGFGGGRSGGGGAGRGW